MDPAEATLRERTALRASAAAVAVLVFAQAPGRIVPETKLDVTLDPVAFLARALGAWDPSAAFGRVQNQAIGYLFPMGPFSVLGRAAGLPPWIVQRAWIALVIGLGLWGAHRVALALGVRTPGGRLTVAWAYALAPATVSLAAFQSAGQLPYALAPHVLVPLLRARAGDDPRRVAARSALVVAAMGGVNGASAWAVLPLALAWFATRAPGRDRRRLVGWWCGGVVAATLWWLVPLLISVRYGVRFTEYTEPASLTTLTESGTEILRGTGNWLSFLDGPAGYWLPGGWALSADRIAIVGSVAVAAGGLVGLVRHDAPGRAWAIPALLLGALVMGVGYPGPAGGPFAAPAHDLLDGALAPFRNVHKFAAVVRLPLALGLGHLVVVAGEHLARTRGRERPQVPHAATALALVVVVAAITPAAAGRLTAPGSFAEVPTWWQDAAAWLDDRDDGDRALLLPASSFGEYRWGRPLDEPLGVLTEHDWAVRDLVPLGGNGSTRVLDAIDRALQGDTLPPGFGPALRRAGIGYLVVRNDLDLVRTGGPRPATIQRLLATAPDVALVAAFGPEHVDPSDDRRLSARPGEAEATTVRELEIWEVDDPDPVATARDAATTAIVGGGPEALLQLDPSLVAERPVALAVDSAADEARAVDGADPLVIATDTARNRDVAFGSVRNNATYTLADDEPSPLSGAAPVDRWPADEPTGLTVARLEGAARIVDSRAPGQSVPAAHQPFAAFDGVPSSTWTPPREGRVGGWIELQLDRSAPLRSARISVPSPDGHRVQDIEIATDGGTVTASIGTDGTVDVPLPEGSTTRLRVTIRSLTGTRAVAPIGLSEIEIDGLDLGRTLVLADTGGRPDAVAVARDRADRFDLDRRDVDPALDRTFSWSGRDARATGTAVSVVGPALDALIADAVDEAADDLRATASSHFRGEPALAASAAFDGDLATGWVSDAEAGAPELVVRWQGPVLVDRIELTPLTKGLDRIDTVEVDLGESTYVRALPHSGVIDLPSTVADSVRLRFPATDEPAEADEPGRRVGVAEVDIPALLGRTAARPDRDRVVELPCGQGPAVVIDGRAVDTTASPTIAQLVDGVPFAWEACGALPLSEAEHRLQAPAGAHGAGAAQAGAASPAVAVASATLAPDSRPAAVARGRDVAIEDWGREARRVQIDGGPASFLVTTENRNEGWRATLDGRELTPVRLDGWRQGWVIPEGGAATVTLRYAPGRVQRLGLVAGLGALALLGVAALLRPRRSSTWAPPEEVPWGSVPVGVATVATGAALGGALVVPALALAAVARARARLALLAAGGTLAGGAVTFVQAAAVVGSGRGTFSGLAQAAAVVALVAVGASALPRRSA